MGVANYDQPKSPQQRMKYSSALAAFQGTWDVIFLEKREVSARFRVLERGIGIGHGKVTTGMVSMAVD